MSELTNFVYLSKYAGQRFDLVQAGGGNTSVKLNDGTMIVKSSGVNLSEIEHDHGYVRLNLEKLKNILSDKNLEKLATRKEKDAYVSSHVEFAVVAGAGKPSIETLMHSLLGKYVLHVHPIVVNAALSHQDLVENFKDFAHKIIFVDYKTPGLDLAVELQKHCGPSGFEGLQIFMLKNHGLIVSGKSAYDVIEVTEDVLAACEKFLGTSFADYRLCNFVSDLVNGVISGNKIAYPICDMQVNNTLLEVLSMIPYCPDQVVYCGIQPLVLKSLEDEAAVKDYVTKIGHAPKIIVYKKNVFCVAQNVRKAREIEDVLKASLLTHALSDNMMDNLSMSEIEYLSGWDAEKHRESI
jgi:rhamnose utilization protein RhaD (predicted bifunctional aldolase and dehydrogenase)